MLHKKSLLWVSLLVVGSLSSDASAVIIPFNLAGVGGEGLRSTNEVTAAGLPANILGTPGSGGEIGAGITYDNVTRLLFLNVGWGSGNGFTNLNTATASATHIHGPTAGTGTAAFSNTAGVLFGLDSTPNVFFNNGTVAGTWANSGTNGSFAGSILLSVAQEANLLAGQYYFNVHTTTNAGGEIRGNLVAVPEPTSMALVGLALSGLAYRRFRRKTKLS